MATKRIELTESGVIFNPEEHTYLLGDRYLSGLTEMIHRQLFPDEFLNIPKNVLDAAAAYGTSVHESCQGFDKEWYNNGTQEVASYIDLCKTYKLIHEASEFTVSDGKNWASNIDKVFRTSDDTFDLADIKTYGIMTPQKLEKARWQLSLYASLFEKQCKKAKVGRLFIIHLRNKQKADGTFDHISEVIFINRIPSELCQELLDCDLQGKQFRNPYSIPDEFRSQESRIRELIETKNAAEEELNDIKSRIMNQMEQLDIRNWATDTMRLTRKLPSLRSSFNLTAFKEDHPEFDYGLYMKQSTVSGSLQIAF